LLGTLYRTRNDIGQKTMGPCFMLKTRGLLPLL
jgi:hypothetical protein